jgi:hypothetical protein
VAEPVADPQPPWRLHEEPKRLGSVEANRPPQFAACAGAHRGGSLGEIVDHDPGGTPEAIGANERCDDNFLLVVGNEASYVVKVGHGDGGRLRRERREPERRRRTLRLAD